MTLTSTCLCLLTQTDGNGQQQVLLGRKKTGFGAGKIVGLGGHVEPGETPSEAAAREANEEAGVHVDPVALQQMAQVIFRFPARPCWDQVVSVFTAARWAGELRESTEITPHWFTVTQLPLADMWDDARYWLPLVLAGHHIRARITYADDCQTVTHAQLRSQTPTRAELCLGIRCP
jgi:8-oxo-dGTP diphosphatase